jgi:phosphate/sulfate permease
MLAGLAAEKFDASSVKPAAAVCRKFKDQPAEAAEGRAWLAKKVDAGSADAMVALGVARLQEADYAGAKELFERATRRNHPAAYYNLGLMSRNGLGVTQDAGVAEKMFRTCIKKEAIPVWIKVICALTMCAGTAAGGWRIIKTLGHKMVKLYPVHGFAAETTSATVLLTAATLGMPVSTTHAITTSIMGVGCAKGFNALRLNVVERIVWAWILTIPASGIAAYALVRAARAAGWLP